MSDAFWNDDDPADDRTADEFFGRDPSADYSYWSRVAHLTPEEAAALAFGFDPRIVHWNNLEGRDHPFVKIFADRVRVIRRAQEIGELLERIRPVEFIEWAKKKGIDFPSEFESAVQLRGNGFRDWQADYAQLVEERDALAAEVQRLREKTSLSKPLLQSEREAMLKIIAAMAVKGYSYVADGNSKVPQEITDDAAGIGIAVDVKTVRKYLQVAARFYSKDDAA